MRSPWSAFSGRLEGLAMAVVLACLVVFYYVLGSVYGVAWLVRVAGVISVPVLVASLGLAVWAWLPDGVYERAKLAALARSWLWPRDRWLRIRNLALVAFVVPAVLDRYLVGVALRLAAMVGLLAFVVFVIYAYEAWRRDRTHTDSYSGDAQVLVHCSDPEQHDRHNPGDVDNPNRWPDTVGEA